MHLVRIGEAAKLLRIDTATLRRRIRGDYAEVFGMRIRAYRMDLGPNAERRFDKDEIERLMVDLGRAK